MILKSFIGTIVFLQIGIQNVKKIQNKLGGIISEIATNNNKLIGFRVLNANTWEITKQAIAFNILYLF